MFRSARSVILVSVLAFPARGGIELWSGDPDDVGIDNQAGIVTIEAAGVFKFQSLDGEDLADISLIEVADGVTGTVEVHVMRDPADEVGTTGARDVNEIDLTNDQGASLVGVLGVIDIGGDLGTLGGVTVNDVTGSLGYIWFADDVQGEITIPDDPGVRPRFSGLRSMILGDLLTPDFSDSRSAGPSGSAAKTRESRARSGILGSACLG